MGEIIHIHIGQAGIQVGESFWEKYTNEHGIQANGSKIEEEDDDESEVSILFSECRNGIYRPRCVFGDLEPTVVDQLKNGKYRQLFNNSQFVNGKEDAANTYARGHFTIGKEVVEVLLSQVKKEIERCESLQGFMITHSICGGTGSGLCSLLMERLSVDFDKVPKVPFTLIPSPQYSSNVMEAYNSVFSTHSLLEHSELSILFDNEALYNHVEKKYGMQCPKFVDINRIIAKYASSLTSSFRFNSKNSYHRLDLNEVISNLSPLPRLHYIIPNLSVFSHNITNDGEKYSLLKHVEDVVHSKESSLVSCDAIKDGKMISCLMDFDCEEHLYNQRELYESIFETRNTLNFVDWAEPLGFKSVVHQHQQKRMKMISTDNINITPPSTISMFSNSTAIKNTFSMINHKFDLLYAPRAFVWWFVIEGCEDGEHSEAREDLAALEKDYEEVEKGFFDEESEEEEEEEEGEEED